MGILITNVRRFGETFGLVEGAVLISVQPVSRNALSRAARQKQLLLVLNARFCIFCLEGQAGCATIIL
jgi:hypothetical protein